MMPCAFVWLEMLNARPHYLIWWVGNSVAEPLKTKHEEILLVAFSTQRLIYKAKHSVPGSPTPITHTAPPLWRACTQRRPEHRQELQPELQYREGTEPDTRALRREVPSGSSECGWKQAVGHDR